LLDFTGLMDLSRRQGWSIVALDCAVDTTTPAGEAMANVLASFAQFERQIIAQRTRDALRQLRSEARVYGPVPYGFTRDGNGLIENAEEQHVLRRIDRLRRRGHSYQRIADALNRSGVPAKRGSRWWPMTVRGVMLTAPSVGTQRAA
jgi:DNA invertase Pin-like site-specific DNA recombinase